MPISLSSIIILITLPLNLLSGLSNAITTPLLLIIFLIENRYNLFTTNIKVILKSHFSVLTFLIWSAISCLWSANIIAAIVTISYNISLFFTVCLVADVIHSKYAFKTYSNDNFNNYPLSYWPKLTFFSNLDLNLILKTTTISLLIANIIFFVEVYTGGFVLKYYVTKFLNKPDYYLILHKFDRGCAILSLFSWLIIGYFILTKQRVLSLVVYLINLYMLAISDSLASLVAYLCSTVCFCLMYITNAKILPLIKYGFFLCAIIFILFCYYMEPENFTEYIDLPNSAKHRLYIWHYVADFFLEHKYIGFGLESARYISSVFAGYIMYKNYAWSLLPLHPHNILLQTLLELGLVGLLLLFFIVRDVFYKIQIINNIHLKTIALVLFSQYFIIGMISYGMWQRWWIATAAITYVYWLILHTAHFTTKQLK